MSFTPSFEEQQQLAHSQRRVRERRAARELISEVLVGGGYVAAAATIWILEPPGTVRVAPAILSLLLLSLATRVRFDTPLGFTVASQLAFVPLLFALPLALVPVAVVVALAIAALPDVFAGRMSPSRLSSVIGNSWFAIGPVAVFVAAGVTPAAAGAGTLVLALGAQFAVDFGVSSIRFGIADGARVVDQLKDSWWVYAIDAALSGVALVVAEAVPDHPLALLSLLPLLALLAVFARERRGRLDSLLELNNAYLGTALVLGNVVEGDDNYTGEHSRAVVTLCLEVAEKLQLSADQRRNIEFGALLHDVGKIAIPKEIINKPGRLDPSEWSIIRTHTIEGQRLLDTVGGFMGEVGMIVRSHHERWDGGGYPDGLKGEAIPLESRIISCCDTWNAMRTDRAYRRALPFDDAIAELRAVAGTQLDPRIVETLLELIAIHRARGGDLTTDPTPLPS